MTMQQSITTKETPSKKVLWTGRIISIICILFLLMDSIMKIAKAAPAMQGTVQLGWPADLIQPIGIVLLICTILYAIPRTALIGAILLTGYLGGAVSVMLRVGQPFWFPIVFGILIWCGVGLRNSKLRAAF
ncbi:MAG TPA: DoxX family protein [Flavipsychrobacter sp.]|nr:DoxX family protein [Flavipsychrobacter sp.]